jgi:glutamate carboxypeptidase
MAAPSAAQGGRMSGLTDRQHALIAAVAARRADWIDLLAQLVDCDSGTDNKEEADRAGRLLAEALGALGFAVERSPQAQFGDHLVARKPGRGPRRLLCLGHFDTVFPRGTVAARPFAIDGERATGPGIYDMKGGLVVLLAALDALRATGAPVWDEVTLTVICNSDEEMMSPTSRPLIVAEARRADTVCVLEPARPGGEYTYVRKGCGMYTLTVAGRAAHSGLLYHQGRSAIAELARKIVLLHEITDLERGTTVNVGVVRGGIRPNVVADQAACEFDLRALTPAEAERAERRFREIAALQFVPDTTTALTGGMLFPPLPALRRNELLFEWVRAAGRLLGLELRAIVSGGASDGNTAGQYAPLIDGMGVCGDGAHSEREFIWLPSLVERAQVLALFLDAWPARAGELDRLAGAGGAPATSTMGGRDD